MGTSISKIKRHRKRKTYQGKSIEETDDPSNIYAEIVDYTPAYISPSDVHQVLETDRHRERTGYQPNLIYRSATEISRDSAYSDDILSSEAASVSSLSHPAFGEVKSRRRPSINNDYFTYDCAQSRRISIGQCSLVQSECCIKEELTSDAIPYMVEVFMPLLQGSIRVLEIIPHLPFIDGVDTFRNKDRESPRDAVIMLIDRIHSLEEPGKWQTFLEALSNGGYKYIHDLLKGETETDLTIQRKLLKLFTPRLINRIDPREFLDHLYEKDVIGETDLEEIQCEETNRGPIAASLMLLESMPRKNPDWYDIFVDVLKKCGLEDMVDDFVIPDSNETTSTSNSRVQHREPFLNYITPVYEVPKMPPRRRRYMNEQRRATRESINSSCYVQTSLCLPFDGSGSVDTSDIDKHPYQTANGSAELTRLQKLKDSLIEELEETKLKKQLEKDIDTLKKELQALHEGDASEETEKDARIENVSKPADPVTVLRETNANEGKEPRSVKDNESQTQDSDIILSHILQNIGELKASMSVFKDEVTTEIQNLKSKETTIDLPRSHYITHDFVPLYNSKSSGGYLAMPHFKRAQSVFDSGFSDYISTSMNSEQYC